VEIEKARNDLVKSEKERECGEKQVKAIEEAMSEVRKEIEFMRTVKT
jgi:hypothetical protein